MYLRDPIRRILAFRGLLLTLTFGLVCSAIGHAQYNLISTPAGGGVVSGSSTGPAADLPGPSSVAQDSQGNTYVSAPDAAQVYKIDPTGTTISVFAGLGWPTEDATQWNGMPAVSAALKEPSGIAVDSTGNVFIVDTNDYLIWEVDTTGIIHWIAGDSHLCSPSTGACGDNRPATSARLNFPEGIATDSNGNIYIADTQDNRIRVVNMQPVGSPPITIATVTIAQGNIATVAGNGVQCPNPLIGNCGDGGRARKANLYNPQGVAVDSHGNIYISDSGDHRVRIVTPDGKINAYAGNGTSCNLKQSQNGCGDSGPATSANLTSPWQLSVDSSGNLYIADAPENRIREVFSNGTITSVAGSGLAGFGGDGGPATSTNAELNAPRGIFFNSTTGYFYIADTGNQRVRQVAPGAAPTISTWAGGGSGNDNGPATSAILAANREVALDPAGNLYIADSTNNRIRVLNTQTGTITVAGVTIGAGDIATVAGTGIAGSTGNNAPALKATLTSPGGIAVDKNNNIYISDTGNNMIRMVNSAGEITTVANLPAKMCSNPTDPCGDKGPAASATFHEPQEIALDSTGNIYIADELDNRIRAINMQSSTINIAGVSIAAGNIDTIAGNGYTCNNPMLGSCGDGGPAIGPLPNSVGQLSAPLGVTVDGSGNVYIADTYDNRIRIVDSSGTINGYAFNGIPGFGPDGVLALDSEYSTPFYLNVDPKGNLYVSGSTLYYVVQRIDVFDNTIWSVAGISGDPKYYGYKGDGGTARGAAIDNDGATIDGSGNFYISDGGNNRVRYVHLVPTAALSTTSLTFPPTPIGQQSGPLNFYDLNNGSDDMYMSGMPQVTGPFTLSKVVGSSPANTCQNEIAPGQNCTYYLMFSPTGYGLQKGSISITNNAANGSPQKVSLFGYGPDYSMTANPTQLTISPGSQGNSTITLTPSAGFNQSITLSCTGAPANSSCNTFSQNPVQMDGMNAMQSTMTVNVGSSTPAGNYTLVVHGLSATDHSASISLTVP